MLDQSTIKGRLVAAAMKLAAERPWREITLAQIAAGAGVGLVDVRREFRTKGDVLAAFVRMVDDAVLARVPARGEGQSPRDALFEVIMSRFDVLAPYKPALKALARSWSFEPALVGAVGASQPWMLRAAGIGADGIEGRLRALGLGAVYASTYDTWLRDDDPGLGKTMAVLDRRLRGAERAQRSFDKAVGKVCGVARSCCASVRERSAAKPAAPQPGPDAAASSTPGAMP